MDNNYIDKLITIINRYTKSIFRYKVDLSTNTVFIYFGVPRSHIILMYAFSRVKELFEKTLNKEIKTVQNQIVLSLQDVMDLYTILKIKGV